MDRKVILAVAGSGKTANIINRLDLESRILIVTYTINNVKNIEGRIIKRFGFVPENIRIFSYFSFVYKFCYRPFLHMKIAATGINFDPCKNRYAQGVDRFKGADGRLYSNRIAKLLEQEGVMDDVKARLFKYFDKIFIDEIQDFGGNDFNLIKQVAKVDREIVYVGDYFQHTFDTSRDGSTNINLHSDYEKYKKCFFDMGLFVDTVTLDKSYRCSPTVCDFVTDSLGIDILSHRKDSVNLVLVKDQEFADRVFEDDEIVKLFYRESRRYSCFSKNWGETKGEDKYHDVCVVLNNTSQMNFDNNTLSDLNPMTKNKLYVAITRAKGDLYFVPEKMFKKYKLK